MKEPIVFDVDRRERKTLTRAALLRLRYEVVRKHGAFEVRAHDPITMYSLFAEFAPYFKHVRNAEEKAMTRGFNISGMRIVPAYN